MTACFRFSPYKRAGSTRVLFMTMHPQAVIHQEYHGNVYPPCPLFLYLQLIIVN